MVANHFVLALLGTQWSEVIPISIVLLGGIDPISFGDRWLDLHFARPDSSVFHDGCDRSIGMFGCICDWSSLGSHGRCLGLFRDYRNRSIPFFTIPARLIDLFLGGGEKSVRNFLLFSGHGVNRLGLGSCYLLPRLTGCFLQSRSLSGSYPISPWLPVFNSIRGSRCAACCSISAESVLVLGPLLQRWGIFGGCSFAD